MPRRKACSYNDKPPAVSNGPCGNAMRLIQVPGPILHRRKRGCSLIPLFERQASSRPASGWRTRSLSYVSPVQGISLTERYTPPARETAPTTTSITHYNLFLLICRLLFNIFNSHQHMWSTEAMAQGPITKPPPCLNPFGRDRSEWHAPFRRRLFTTPMAFNRRTPGPSAGCRRV